MKFLRQMLADMAAMSPQQWMVVFLAQGSLSMLGAFAVMENSLLGSRIFCVVGIVAYIFAGIALVLHRNALREHTLELKRRVREQEAQGFISRSMVVTRPVWSIQEQTIEDPATNLLFHFRHNRNGEPRLYIEALTDGEPCNVFGTRDFAWDGNGELVGRGTSLAPKRCSEEA